MLPHGRSRCGGYSVLDGPGLSGAITDAKAELPGFPHQGRRGRPIETTQPGRYPIARVHPPATRNVSGIPPAAPQRTMILRRPSRAKSPFCPLTRCPASPTGIPGQVLHPPFTHGGVENRVSEGYGQRNRSHLRGRTVVECRSSPAPWSSTTTTSCLVGWLDR